MTAATDRREMIARFTLAECAEEVRRIRHAFSDKERALECVALADRLAAFAVPDAGEARIAGFPIAVDSTLAADVAEFRDKSGNLVGRITGLDFRATQPAGDVGVGTPRSERHSADALSQKAAQPVDCDSESRVGLPHANTASPVAAPEDGERLGYAIWEAGTPSLVRGVDDDFIHDDRAEQEAKAKEYGSGAYEVVEVRLLRAARQRTELLAPSVPRDAE